MDERYIIYEIIGFLSAAMTKRITKITTMSHNIYYVKLIIFEQKQAVVFAVLVIIGPPPAFNAEIF